MKITSSLFVVITTVVILFPCLSSANNATQKKASSRERLTTGPLITDTAVPQDLGSGTLFLPVFLRFSDSKFDSQGHVRDAGQRSCSFAIPFQVFYGIAERTEAYLIIPYHENWVEDSTSPGPEGQRSANYGGMGDSNISIKAVRGRNRYRSRTLQSGWKHYAEWIEKLSVRKINNGLVRENEMLRNRMQEAMNILGAAALSDIGPYRS